MVGLCFSAFHSYFPGDMHSVHRVCHKEVWRCNDGYQSKSNDSPETYQRARRSYRNLHGEYASHHEKGSVSCKQAAIHHHAQYKTGTGELQNVSRDANLLIVQKAVESASAHLPCKLRFSQLVFETRAKEILGYVAVKQHLGRD